MSILDLNTTALLNNLVLLWYSLQTFTVLMMRYSLCPKDEAKTLYLNSEQKLFYIIMYTATPNPQKTWNQELCIIKHTAPIVFSLSLQILFCLLLLHSQQITNLTRLSHVKTISHSAPPYWPRHQRALPVSEAGEMRQQQLQNRRIRDGANDTVSPYLTAPPIVLLSLSLLLVEAIISPPNLLLANLAQSILSVT